MTPPAVSVCARYMTLPDDGDERAAAWICRRRQLRLVAIFALPLWWALITLAPTKQELSPYAPEWILIVVPFSASILLAQTISCRSDRDLLGRNWTGVDVLKLGTYGTVSFTVPLLLVAVAVDDGFDHNLAAIAWLMASGVFALFGGALLRYAEGFKPRGIKGGPLYKRATVLAKSMDIHLRQVSVVPFGRGRLTNAFGGPNGIAVTDDYGHWLHGAQLDSVIAHELAHIKHNDVRKKFTAIVTFFAAPVALAFTFPGLSSTPRFLFDLAALLIPLAFYYFLMRRREYAADRVAAEFTDPRTTSGALTSLYNHVGVPENSTPLMEAFSTHPSLKNRLRAIAKVALAAGIGLPETVEKSANPASTHRF